MCGAQSTFDKTRKTSQATTPNARLPNHRSGPGILEIAAGRDVHLELVPHVAHEREGHAEVLRIPVQEQHHLSQRLRSRHIITAASGVLCVFGTPVV